MVIFPKTRKTLPLKKRIADKSKQAAHKKSLGKKAKNHTPIHPKPF